MLGKILAIATVVATILLMVIFYATTPSTAGPLGVLFVFILMYVVALGLLTFLIFLFSNLAQRAINVLVAAKRPIQPISFVRSYYFASVTALAPVMLIGIHSVGQLGFYDVLLVVLFIIISCIYVAKRAR